jgi:hypothetical protein
MGGKGLKGRSGEAYVVKGRRDGAGADVVGVLGDPCYVDCVWPGGLARGEQI